MDWPSPEEAQPATPDASIRCVSDANHVMLGGIAKARGGIAEIFKIAR